MRIKKNEVNRLFVLFLFSHLIIWTLIPTFSNINLPLDVIEAITRGNGWPLGWDKHPPLSIWFPRFFFEIFGNQDWVFYLLSQIFVVLSFIIIFQFSKDFFKNSSYSLLSVLLLEGICFYNFTTPEFNVNVCQLPFWTLAVYYCWQGIKQNDNFSWLMLGVFAALGILSKYLFIYLLIGIDVFFIYLIIKKKINFRCLISLITFFLVLLPHLIWLVDNNYATITYALHRSGIDGSNFFQTHLFQPILFLGKQFIVLFPFFILFLFVIYKFNIKINFKDKKLIFLLAINIIPIILMFLTSLLMGAKIKTMWMAPFYLFIGVLFVYLFQKKIDIRKLKYFVPVFLFLLAFYPSAYFLKSSIGLKDRIEITNTDYPGKKISQMVHEKWKNNFSNEIEIVVGQGWTNEWYAGNLAYHLKSKPKWIMKLDKELNVGTIWIEGFDKIKNCDGILYKIKPFNDVCMVGTK